MLAGARLQRRRRQLHQPQQSRRRQPFPWPMNADPPPPPWVWMVPGSAGLLRLGAGVAPPPVLLASAQPAAAPLLARLPGWPAPGEPLLPLLPLPSAPDHAVHHYPLLPGQVTSRPRSPLRLRITGFLPSPGLGWCSSLSRWFSVLHAIRTQPHSHTLARKFMLRRPVLPWQFFFFLHSPLPPLRLSSERLRPCNPCWSQRAWTQLSQGAGRCPERGAEVAAADLSAATNYRGCHRLEVNTFTASARLESKLRINSYF